MSISAKLDVFTLRIREKGNKNEYLDLDDISGFKLLEEISLYLGKNIYLFKIDKEAQRTSRIEKNELENNSLFCRIKIGKFGESSEIVDTLSGSGIFHKEPEHSDTIPLFFHLKADGKKALLNIEKYNNISLLPEIRSILKTVLENIRSDKYSFELKPLKTSISISEFVGSGYGVISSVNLTLDDDTENEFIEPITLKIKTKARKDFPENMEKKIIKGSQSSNLKYFKDLLPEPLKNIEITDVSLDLRVKDKGSIKVRYNEDITLTNSYSIPVDSDTLDRLGHPSYSFLKEFSSNL